MFIAWASWASFRNVIFVSDCISSWTLFYLPNLFQMQFIAFVVHTGYNILSDCDFPKGYSIAVFIYAISLIVLFGNFYYHTYNKKTRHDKDLKSA